MKLSTRFDEALTFASDLHRDQVRKGSNVPYIAHLLGVCSLVLEYGGDENCAIAALLHDAVEDQGGTETQKQIYRKFGEEVGKIVDGCTDASTEPKPPWQERKQAYIEQIPEMSHEVALVSAADKLYNAQSILKDYQEVGNEIWERFKGKKAGTLWYYRSVVNAFRQRKVTPIVEALTAVVKQLETVANESATEERLR